MERDRAHRPEILGALQQCDDFGGKAGKSGEPAQEAGDDQELGLGRQIDIDVKHRHRDPDQVAADQVGREGAQGNGRE